MILYEILLSQATGLAWCIWHIMGDTERRSVPLYGFHTTKPGAGALSAPQSGP
jgi:hypothetical protein